LIDIDIAMKQIAETT